MTPLASWPGSRARTGHCPAWPWIRGFVPVPGVNRHRYEVNVPASERDKSWFAIPSDYEGAARALEAAQAYVSLAKWREENESGV